MKCSVCGYETVACVKVPLPQPVTVLAPEPEPYDLSEVRGRTAVLCLLCAAAVTRRPRRDAP